MSVTVYTMPDCVQRDMTKKVLTRENVEFSTVDISTNSEAYEFITSLGYKQAPVVVAGESHWSGFRIDKIASLRAMQTQPSILKVKERAKPMSVEHKHILINARVNNPLNRFEEATEFLTELVDKVGMKILMGPHATYVNTPGNQGVTAIVGIETSHIAFHVWDEEMPARLQFDLYTCGSLDKDVVLEAVHRKFDVVSADYRIYDRETGFVLLEEGTLPS